MQAPIEMEERRIRVFISSTFRDMQAERDELVKRIFPKLRKICIERGVTWGEIDLRWGIPDEKSSEGKVLPICLAEIRRCRPFFIGILGERYGWIPKEIPSELVEHEPWLAIHRQRSVTELEIMHGVLNDPSLAQYAYFYFRDPAYLDTLPREEQGNFYETPGLEEIKEFGFADALHHAENRRDKLNDLKQRIRTSGLPLRENYPDPVVLGQCVYEDMLALIDHLYPEGQKFGALEREKAEQDSYAASRLGVYIGRFAYFEKLDAHAQGDGLPLVVLGESGAGKSALLANWAWRFRQMYPDELLIIQFLGSGSSSADWAAMIRRILGELKERFNIQLGIPESQEELRSAFAKWLNIAAGRGRLVLILDALDQLEDRAGAQDLVWLPEIIPANVRLVLSTLPGRPLDELRKRGWPVLQVEPLNMKERKQLIEVYLQEFGKSLNLTILERIANAPQTANPLFLRVLLDELRIYGIHELLEQHINDYLQASAPDDLYEMVLSRCEHDYERERPGLVGEAMSLIWAARGGLAEVELQEMLGTPINPLPGAIWSPLSLALEGSLQNKGGMILFSHDYFRKAVHDRYLATEEVQRLAHLRIADYFEGREVDMRKTSELPWQLVQAKEWQRLYGLLGNLDFFEPMAESNPSEVEECWAKIEANSSFRMVDAYRQVINEPGKYPQVLWEIGTLLTETNNYNEALAVRKYMVQYYRQAGDQGRLQRALGNLSNILIDRGELHGAMILIREKESICREIGDLEGLSDALNKHANLLADQGELKGAMTLHKEAEKLYRRMDDLEGLSISLGNQATILHDMGNLRGAMELLKEQERLDRESNYKRGLAISFGNQANILQEMGDLDGALVLQKKNERICRELGNRAGLSLSLGNQGNILLSQGDLDGALTLHQEHERISRELGRPYGIALALLNQSVIMARKGNQKEARRMADEGYAIAFEHGYMPLAKDIKQRKRMFWIMPFASKLVNMLIKWSLRK